jgi:sialidase-1
MQPRRTTNRRQVFEALAVGAVPARAFARPLRKLEEIVIYRDEAFYAAFPSIVRRPDDELLVAFRRAPERRRFGEKLTTHADPNSQLVLVRSRDGGCTWSREPELIYAHPFGGLQDPCMIQLRNGAILCSSYGWLRLFVNRLEKPRKDIRHGEFLFLGGLLLRSDDGGRSWKGPFRPPPMPEPDALDPWGQPLPLFNRGAMCQGRDGRLFWVVRCFRMGRRPDDLHLLVSEDGGLNWRYSCVAAADPKVAFSETSLIQTPAGDLVGFVRTMNLDNHTVVIRSRDGGRSFDPWQDAGFQGSPHHALRLPDGRVWLVYGYRHPPFGVRARILNPECTDFATAPEIVLRDDGGNADVGYPWSALLPGGRVLTVYYFNLADGPRFIAGTICG